MYWTIFIVALALYLFVVLYVSVHEMKEINNTGKLLVQKTLALKELALAHGYSKDGWERFSEYQLFYEEYKEAIDVYADWKKNKVIFALKMFAVMLYMAPHMLSIYNKERKQRLATAESAQNHAGEALEKAKKEERD